MRCEVIAVGTELLLGQIVDTNSAWIGEQLALAGIDTHYQTKVGDNFERIAASIRLGLERSDAIIMCGGLGPTQDDITRDVIASVMGVELVRRDDLVARIRAMFEARGREMPLNNLRQADVPEGATIMDQMPGTAPGLVCPVRGPGGEQVVYAVPGVPSEMRQMVVGTVVPDLQRRSGSTAMIGSRVLRTWGHSESGLAELLAPRIDELDRGGAATLAFLASGAEGLKVRITAKAPDPDALRTVLDAEEALLRELLGDLVFGLDDDTMESVLLGLLADRGMRMAVVEVASGGYLTARLTQHALAGDVLAGSLVTSAERAAELLHRPAPVHGSGDEPTGEGSAGALAAAAAARHGVEVGIAVGASTPRDRGGVDVAVGWSVGAEVRSWTVAVPGDVERLRAFSGISLLNDLRLHLLA